MQSYIDVEPHGAGETAKARDWAAEWESSVVDGSYERNTRGRWDSTGAWLVWGNAGR